MSGPAGAAPPTAVLSLGLDISGPWHQRAAQKSRAWVHTHLLTSSAHPPPTAAGGGSRGPNTHLRLPSLVASARETRRRSSMARLSLSEPSLLIPHDHVLYDGFSINCHPTFSQKRPPPPPSFSKSSALLPCNTRRQSGAGQHVQNCSRPAYIHFSQAIQLRSKPRPVRRCSHHPALSAEIGGLQASVIQDHNSLSQGDPLSVTGKPCLPSCSEGPTVAAAVSPARPQLHVFLPTEAEREEMDSESVDEGFMDELDSKITSLFLQQGAPKMALYH